MKKKIHGKDIFLIITCTCVSQRIRCMYQCSVMSLQSIMEKNVHTFFTGQSLITTIATIHTASVKTVAGVHLKTVSTLFTAVSSIRITITS